MVGAPHPEPPAHAAQPFRRRVQRRSGGRSPIHPLQRGAFLEALAKELERHPVVGPGVVHRCAAALQKSFVVAAHAETSRSAEPRHRGARQAGG